MACGYAYKVVRRDGTGRDEHKMLQRGKYRRGIFERNFIGGGEHKKFIRKSSAYFYATRRLDRFQNSHTLSYL